MPAVYAPVADPAPGPDLAAPLSAAPAGDGDVLWTPRKVVAPPPSPKMDAPPLLPPPRFLHDAPDKPPAPDENQAVLLGAARNAVRQQKWDVALARFEEYFKRYGEDFELRKEYAGVLVQAGRLPDALAEFRRLAAQKPGDRDVLVSLADAAVQAREYALAVATLARVLQMAPGDREAAVKLARAYVFDGDFAYALRVYDDYLAGVRPEDGRARAACPTC